MFCGSALIVIAILAVLAKCTSLQTMPNMTRVSLIKRGSFIKKDGSFDLDSAMAHTAYTMNKYRQNMINFRRNVGGEAFNDSADTEPIATLPVGLQKRQAAPLSYPYISQWTTNVSIGTPPQYFVMSVDTATADLWVVSRLCGPACGDKNQYNRIESHTANSHGDRISISDIDSNTVSGVLFDDTVQVAGISVTSQYFVTVIHMTLMPKLLAIDGTIGLSYKALSASKRRPFFNTALALGSVPQGIFAFSLGDTGAELYLGGNDEAKYSGSIEYHSVVSPLAGYWRLGGASVLVDSKVVASDFETVFDTSVSFMYGPRDQVAAIYQKIPNSSVIIPDDATDVYQFPCEYPPDLEFSWGGNSWPVSAQTFYHGEREPGSDMCLGSVIGQHWPYLGPNTWVLGDSFMRNAYMVFSLEDNTIGFAARAA